MGHAWGCGRRRTGASAAGHSTGAYIAGSPKRGFSQLPQTQG